jgi:hypothetical protein
LKSGERSMRRLSSSSTRPSEWEISRAMPVRLLARRISLIRAFWRLLLHYSARAGTSEGVLTPW